MERHLRLRCHLSKGQMGQCPHHASILRRIMHVIPHALSLLVVVGYNVSLWRTWISAVSWDEAVRNCKNIPQSVETGEQNTLSATSAQDTTAKIQGCANVLSNSSWSEGTRQGWQTPRVDGLKPVNQGSPNFFVLGPHKLIKNMSRAGLFT